MLSCQRDDSKTCGGHYRRIRGHRAGDGATALRLAREGAAIAIVADVTRAADMDALVVRTVERFGRLDVMMCNAGFGIAGAIDDIAPDQMQKLVDINYTLDRLCGLRGLCVPRS